MELKVKKDQLNILLVEYWGGSPGNKTFDILVDDEKIATENISLKKDGFFILEEYPIPQDLTQGKDKITVKFQAHPGGHRVGPIFGVRIIPEMD